MSIPWLPTMFVHVSTHTRSPNPNCFVAVLLAGESAFLVVGAKPVHLLRSVLPDDLPQTVELGRGYYAGPERLLELFHGDVGPRDLLRLLLRRWLLQAHGVDLAILVVAVHVTIAVIVLSVAATFERVLLHKSRLGALVFDLLDGLGRLDTLLLLRARRTAHQRHDRNTTQNQYKAFHYIPPRPRVCIRRAHMVRPGG